MWLTMLWRFSACTQELHDNVAVHTIATAEQGRGVHRAGSFKGDMDTAWPGMCGLL